VVFLAAICLAGGDVQPQAAASDAVWRTTPRSECWPCTGTIRRKTGCGSWGQDPGVGCCVYAARALWVLGYPAQALARIHEALTLAHGLSHPYSLAYARVFEAYVSQYRQDVPAASDQAEAAVTLSTERGFQYWTALGTILRGWALALQGQGEEGIV